MTQTEKALQAANQTKVSTVWEYFEKRKGDIAKVLPKHITVDRLIGVMGYMIKSNPDIASASQASLIAAVIQTCQSGLEPGNMGHCYYVPFNNRKRDGSVQKEVQYILGYKGIIELVNRAGKAVILSTECVFAKDGFKYAQGLNPILEHIPSTEKDRGDFVGVYCTAKNLIANEKLFVFLGKEEVEKVRKASKAGNSEYSPWAKWYEEMAKKTAVKRIAKLLPISVEIQRNIAQDETTKTRIDPDMAALPDETNWSDPGVIDVDPIDPTPETSAELTEGEKADAAIANEELKKKKAAAKTTLIAIALLLVCSTAFASDLFGDHRQVTCNQMGDSLVCN